MATRPFPEACHLPLDLIDPNPDQPRQNLAGIEELAAHVKLYGVLQPVVVTRSAAQEGRYTLVAGHRRLAALRWLAAHDDYPDRWRDIPAVVRGVETADRLTLALAENLARHALADAEVVTAVRVLVDLHGWSQAQIARRLGVSEQWIGQYARVIAHPDLAGYVQTGRLSAAKAYEIQRARTPEARQAALDAALQGASLRTIRQTAARASPPAAGPADPTVPTAGSVGCLTDPAPTPLPLPADHAHSPATLGLGAHSIDESGTDSHTVAVPSDWTFDATTSPATGERDHDVRIDVRTLAIHALLQETHRARRPSVPARAVRAALLHDLRSLDSHPATP